jgi:cysteine synthase A
MKVNNLKDCGCYENDMFTTMEAKLTNKLEHLWHMVGNTPMLEISYRYQEQCRKLYVKCENYNLNG